MSPSPNPLKLSSFLSLQGIQFQVKLHQDSFNSLLNGWGGEDTVLICLFYYCNPLLICKGDVSWTLSSSIMNRYQIGDGYIFCFQFMHTRALWLGRVFEKSRASFQPPLRRSIVVTPPSPNHLISKGIPTPTKLSHRGTTDSSKPHDCWNEDFQNNG